MNWPLSKGIGLRRGVTLGFGALIVLIVGIVAISTYRANTQVTLKTAHDLLDLTSETMLSDVAAGLLPIARAVDATATLASNHPQAMRDQAYLRYFFRILELNPQVYSIYIGYQKEGDYAQLIRLPDGVERFGPNDEAPPVDALYVRRTIQKRGAERVDRYEYLADWDQVLKTEERISRFDPREQPFYQAAWEKGELVTSDVYLFNSSGHPGISISAPISVGDQRFAVVAADIALDNLALFLSSHQIGERGFTMILDAKNRVIAYPDMNRALRIDGNNVRLSSAAELGIPALDEALRRYRAGQGSRLVFDEPVSGTPYLASFRSFPPALGKDWMILTLAPQEDFVGELQRANRVILAISAALLALGLLLVAFFSRYLTRPIAAVIEETRKIQALDLKEDIAIRSNIREIRQLVDATQAMKSTIRAFTTFVPRTLVQQLLSSGKTLEVGGQSRYLTIMFTDMDGFSALAETTPTRELMTRVSTHLDTVTRVIGTHHGTLDKYIGDAVMAFWGAPMPDDEHAYHACITALKAQHAMNAVNQAWIAEGKSPTSFRIGLHTDAVLVGNIGSAERLSYTVMGDGVNIAAYLETLNKTYGTRICVSHSVFKEAGERMLMRPLDQVSVKGRRGELVVYELLAAIGPDAEAAGIAATPSQQRLVELTLPAFAAWQAGRMEDALDRYRVVAQAFPHDPVARLFISRCTTASTANG
jgi:adenylate cyclase